VVNRRKLFQYQRRPEVVPGVVHERSPVLTSILPSPREKAGRVVREAQSSPRLRGGATLRSPRGGGSRAFPGSTPPAGASPAAAASSAAGGTTSYLTPGAAGSSAQARTPKPVGSGSGGGGGAAGGGGGGPGVGVHRGTSWNAIPLEFVQGLSSVSTADLGAGLPALRFAMPRDLGAYMATVPWSMYNPDEGPVPLSVGGVGGTVQPSGFAKGSSASLTTYGFGDRRALSRLSATSRASNWVLEPIGQGGIRRDRSHASIGGGGGRESATGARGRR
jgi:hypothetical protein